MIQTRRDLINNSPTLQVQRTLKIPEAFPDRTNIIDRKRTDESRKTFESKHSNEPLKKRRHTIKVGKNEAILEKIKDMMKSQTQQVRPEDIERMIRESPYIADLKDDLMTMEENIMTNIEGFQEDVLEDLEKFRKNFNTFSMKMDGEKQQMQELVYNQITVIEARTEEKVDKMGEKINQGVKD